MKASRGSSSRPSKIRWYEYAGLALLVLSVAILLYTRFFQPEVWAYVFRF